ncbi:DUF262 domain-containing protein [Desulfobacterales bacterium HSG16]|nr:DUF262 domain-containing protein [Desulfobacterales bacterium HSG16]
MVNLFQDEQIDFSEGFSEQSVKKNSKEINNKYARGEIRIVTEQARYPLNTIVSMLDSGDYQLNPEFQRRHRWSQEKQSVLIESFIMNVPIPPIFLYEVSYSYYEVMDGLQRLTAIYEFYKGKYCLTGLVKWPELNGYDYNNLPELVKKGIDRRFISSIILLRETAKNEQEAEKLKQLVFDRINSGGEKLEPQESRNALYNGPLNQLCIKLARTQSFCKMWQIPEPTESELRGEIPEELIRDIHYRKMNDVELVLRFFAYRQIERFDKAILRDFLDAYLKNGNLFTSELLKRLGKLFLMTSDLVCNILGERAFYLYRKRKKDKWEWFKRPTKVLYDPVMYAFSRYCEQSEQLIEKKDAINKSLTPFYMKNEDIFAGRSTNKRDIIKRRVLFLNFIKEFVE